MSQLLSLFVVESGMDPGDVARVVRTAPSRYKVYEIPKRSGGTREIAQPARELKVLQRILIDKVLCQLPVHQAATAYRKGMSILDNAAPHRGDSPILKLDFENFFPSIRGEDWVRYCEDNSFLSADDREIAALVLFRRAKGERVLKLSVGAPSSPMLSNIMMFRFDELVGAAAAKRNINYTRYADDMSFSGQRAGMLKDMVKEVIFATRTIIYPQLKLNKDKTTLVTTSNRRSITGVVLTNSGEAGLGHQRKRLISAKVHHAIRGKLNGSELRRLAGELAFVNVVERPFLEWLSDKYGKDEIEKIKRMIIV